MQIAAGLCRLGHDAYYFETSSNWPYDPIRNTNVGDSDYALPYLERVAAEAFGLEDRWAYRRSYVGQAWFGLSRSKAEELLAARRCRPQRRRCYAVRRRQGSSWSPRLLRYRPGATTKSRSPTATKKCNRSSKNMMTLSPTAKTSAARTVQCPCRRACVRRRGNRCCSISGRTARLSKQEFTTVGNWQQDGRDVRYSRGDLSLEQAPRVPEVH